jgi:hypothetical protein
MWQRVSKIQNSHLWSWVNPHPTHVCGYQVQFSVNEWADIKEGNPCRPLPATTPAGCSETQRSTTTLLGKCPEVVNMMYPWRRTEYAGPTTWPPYSPDLTLLDFIVCGHMKKHLCTFSHKYQRSHSKISCCCYNCWWWHNETCIRKYQWCNAVCPEKHGARF